jgi:transposase
MMKRLGDAKFHWPPEANVHRERQALTRDGMIKLSAAQLSALLEGVAWAQVERREAVRPSAVQ